MLPGGADQRRLRPDGTKGLDPLYEMRVDDGAVPTIRKRVRVDETLQPRHRPHGGRRRVTGRALGVNEVPRLRRRRHPIHAMTSVMAAAPNAGSAYLRFSRAFTGISPRMRVGSLTDTPARLLVHAPYVAAPIGGLRPSSATATPAVSSFSIDTVWLSLHVLFLNASSSSSSRPQSPESRADQQGEIAFRHACAAMPQAGLAPHRRPGSFWPRDPPARFEALALEFLAAA